MPRAAISSSPSIASLLRGRRRELGLSLRDVELRTQEMGQVIPFTTLSKVEQGTVDPGVRRLHQLLRVYDLSPQLTHDLLDLEGFVEEFPDVASHRSLESLKEEGLEAWKSGKVRKGLAYLFAVRAKAPADDAARLERQRAILDVAVAVGSLGKFRLSRQLLDDLLLEPPAPELLVNVLIQSAVCWHWLGSGEAALGFLWRAERNLSPGDHKRAAWVYHERAGTLATLHQFAAAEEQLDKAIEEYRRGKDPYGVGRASGVRVRILFDRGDLDAALAVSREARRQAEQGGFERLGVARALDEGRCLIALGRPREALVALQRCLVSAISTDDAAVRFYAHYYLWKAYAASGDSPRAELELNNARFFVRLVDELTPETEEIRG